jgi:hypothetical protein
MNTDERRFFDSPTGRCPGTIQTDHIWKPIDAGERREDVAAALNADRTTVYRALGNVGSQ